jgi:catechol 2,3-dioxygenase-like lactoylglutathione lyase family enzyme
MDPRINVITLGVKDFRRSLAFYRDGLGWTAQVQDDIACFPLNGIVFALYPRDSLAKDAAIPAQGTGFPGFTLAVLTKNEAEVDAILKKAKGLGARVLIPGRKTFWGGYGGYFADPDDFLWEVAYNPFWKPDRNGTVTF